MIIATATSPFTGTVFTRTSKSRIYTHAVVSYVTADVVRELARKAADWNELQGKIRRAAAEYKRTGKIDPVLNMMVSSGSLNERAYVRTELDKLNYEMTRDWNPTPEQYDVWATGYELRAEAQRKIATGALPLVNNESVSFHQSYENAIKTGLAQRGRRGQVIETVVTKGGK